MHRGIINHYVDTIPDFILGLIDLGQHQMLLPGFFQDGFRDGVRLAVFRRRRVGENIVFIVLRKGMDLTNIRLFAGQGPRLVKHHGIHARQLFESAPVFHQKIVPGSTIQKVEHAQRSHDLDAQEHVGIEDGHGTRGPYREQR